MLTFFPAFFAAMFSVDSPRVTAPVRDTTGGATADQRGSITAKRRWGANGSLRQPRKAWCQMLQHTNVTHA